MSQEFSKPGKAPGAVQGKLPLAIESVRAQAQSRVEVLIGEMLGRVEGIVFEWCQGVGSSEQQHFMDIIIEVRRSKEQMAADFLRAFGGSFLALPQQKKGDKEKADKAGFGKVDFASLSLVASDDMDVKVAIDGMVAKSRAGCGNALALLRARFQHVMPEISLDDQGFPLDPGAITEHFGNILKNLALTTDQKVLVLKIFQQELLSKWPALLDDANQSLINAGILPDLKVTYAAPKPGDDSGRQEKKEEKKLDTEDIFAFMKDVSNISKTAVAGAVGGIAGVPGAPAGAGVSGATYHGGEYVGGGGVGALSASAVGGSVAAVPIVPENIAATAHVQALATEQLVGLLSKLQEIQPRNKLSDDDTSPSVSEVRQGIRKNLRSDEKTVEAVRQADEDVINLVSMLFDFILDDDDLPTAMKALLGRLQIPLLKVAIIDKTFFNVENHTARQLLNLLAKAGIGWNQKDPGGDALYSKIEEVVFRILNEFIADITLFDDLLKDFSDFYDQQQKRSDAIDKRTREAEEGRARADMARAMVQQLLNRRLTGRQLPMVVVKLLQEGWKHVLYINCLKDGTESEAWKQAVKVVDAIVWSVIPQPGPEWIARLKNVSPKLINSLKKGLAAVNYDALATDSLLRELSNVHMELMGGHEMATVTVLDAESARTEGPSEGMISADQMGKTGQLNVAAVVLPGDTVSPSMVESLPSDDMNVLKVNQLNVGSWVEFVQTDRRDRHKLVARIRSVDKLIFANRRGIKVAEMSSMKLAVDMSQGRARIIEEAQVLDRALESVIGNLRQLNEQQGKQGA
ncbi:MAG: DUF1631 domain-containing protein [Fluviicoccus sp.]|uniref:DUF1631 domain-containing protein n=1 Tax=Fluviicoccus sp. TaxID=2003552 RepID=UPI00271FE4CE|nr:DUF1631 domain-containing protein [Fluviicoccus sp.]MDO8330689.1 DUF1631 domain-containing protein [Fluviicoccus sp.]